MFNIHIFFHELKSKKTLVIVWTLIFALFLILTFGFFEPMKAQSAKMEEMLKSFPPELLTIFGADAKSLTELNGYFTGQFMGLYLIANTILAAYLGAANIGKEITSQSIVLLATKPLKRANIYLSKMLSSAVLLFILNLLLWFCSIIFTKLLTSENASIVFFTLDFLGAFVLQLVFLALGQMSGVCLGDSQSVLIGVGVSFGSWIIDNLSKLKGVPEFIRYLTPYHYFDTLGISRSLNWEIKDALVLIAITIVLTIIGVWKFRRKEIL